jgi:hypothetical protein
MASDRHPARENPWQAIGSRFGSSDFEAFGGFYTWAAWKFDFPMPSLILKMVRA